MLQILESELRITEPEPTAGLAPSHSPPDVRYAPGLGVARGLGWFGIILGLGELLAPRAIADITGVRRLGLLQLYGLREIVTGLGVLSDDQPGGWMWARVGGDALDLAALASAWADGNDEQRTRAAVATAAVLGVTALDLVCALKLSAAEALEG